MVFLDWLTQSPIVEHLGYYHFKLSMNIFITISLDSSLFMLLGFVSGSQLIESQACCSAQANFHTERWNWFILTPAVYEDDHFSSPFSKPDSIIFLNLILVSSILWVCSANCCKSLRCDSFYIGPASDSDDFLL